MEEMDLIVVMDAVLPARSWTLMLDKMYAISNARRLTTRMLREMTVRLCSAHE